jgi:hypothetical protein
MTVALKMSSYKERIIKAIEDSEAGLTTVDVAKRAGVSKTTVIKYLSVLKSEGLCEFVEVGPSKLWKVRNSLGEMENVFLLDDGESNASGVNLLDAEVCCEGRDSDTISLSFKVRPDELCAIMRRSKKCICH